MVAESEIFRKSRLAFRRFFFSLPPTKTVVVAQLVEPQIVILVVAGSSPVDHPNFLKPLSFGEAAFTFIRPSA